MGLFDIFKTESKPKKDKYQKDDAVDLIRKKKFAIFGFGPQGQVHAQNLKDSGIDNIVIALRDNSKSKSDAETKGFKVMKFSRAAEWADIIMILLPDDVQKDIYTKYIEQYVKEGSVIGFHTKSHLQEKNFIIRPDLGEFNIFSNLNGKALRNSFKKGNTLKEFSYTVDSKRSFAPYDIALAYLIAIGSSSPDISYITNEKNPFDPKRLETSIHQEIWVQCSNKNCKDYSHHFQIREASIEFRKCPECGKKLKNVSGKINPNTQGSGIINPKNEEEKKQGTSVGTGFFVDNKGHIVTNYHVVKSNENRSKIIFKNEETKVNVIAYDEILDIALLKAKVKNKNYIKFSNSSPTKAQNILVAGYPYGKDISDDLKITSGIINSLKGIKNNTSMLQIDAAVNPGNSGGPIVDKETGSLVGVATMKLSKDYTKAAYGVESENINYGIKSSQVKDFLEANNINISLKKNKLKISELEESTVFVFS